MTTASWLRTVVAPSPAEPGPELLQHLQACRRDLTGDVVARTTAVSEQIFAFVAHHTSTDSSSPALAAAETASGETPPAAATGGRGASSAYDATWPELRRQETVKLYYRVLGRLCSAEAERVRGQDLTALLANERFHRSLLACCAELVLASHKATAHTFPSILAPAGVSAFDMDKVMESLVRHEDTLPGELRKHLHACDERILESLAWAKGSSLYLALIAARRHLAAEVVRLGLLPPHSQSSGLELGEATSRAGLPQATTEGEPAVPTPALLRLSGPPGRPACAVHWYDRVGSVAPRMVSARGAGLSLLPRASCHGAHE